MRYNKIIIFYTSNYCQKIKTFFDVDKLIENGVQVEFWDLSDITVHEYLQPVISDGLIERKISTLKHFEEQVIANDKALFASFVNYAHYSFDVYKILSKHNVDILYSTSGVVPCVPERKIYKIFKIKSMDGLFRFIMNQCRKLTLKTKVFKPAKYVLISCNKASCDYKISKDTVFLACNSGDFNGFFKSNSSTVSGITRKIVFIDQYIPFHNDFSIKGLPHIDAEKYYSALNAFLKKIEDAYNTEVIICAHPSAVLYKEKDFFDGRQVVYNETASSVKDSMGVILQFSTALSLAIMANKPILMFTTDEINTLYPDIYNFTKYCSDTLNISLLNIDSECNCNFSPINIEAYNRYIMDYLTMHKEPRVDNFEVLYSILNDDYHKFKL